MGARRTSTARGRVIRLLAKAKTPLTKQQVADELGLSMPPVYQALSTLAQEGLVESAGELSSTGGRPASVFAVRPRGRCFAGISVTAHHLTIALCGLDGVVWAHRRVRHAAFADAQGPDGARGLVGARELAGTRGPAGAWGPSGAQGPAGARELTGTQGPDGTQEPDGTRWHCAARGLAGTKGHDGIRESIGAQVLAGTRVHSTTREPAGVQGLGALMGEELGRLLAEEGTDSSLLGGACVAVPGVIDPASGDIVQAPVLALGSTPARELLGGFWEGLGAEAGGRGAVRPGSHEAQRPGPCGATQPGAHRPARHGTLSDRPEPLLENDACCGGFAECYGSPELENLAYLSLEDGVGGAILANGRSFSGVHGRAAEFGHLCVEPGGARCSCGQRGCLEAYCSKRLLASDDRDLAAFFARLAEGEPAELDTWESYAAHLARAVNDIRMTLDCDVVLGGSVAAHLDPWLDSLQRRVARLDPFGSDGSYLRLSRDSAHAVTHGAALKALASFLDRA